MSDLKPCPFCGGKARLIRKPIFSIDGGFMANDGSYHIVVCDTPSCASVGYYGREQEAIDAWNTRAEVVFVPGFTTATDSLPTRYVPERTCYVVNEIYDDVFGVEIQLSCGHNTPMFRENFNYCPACGARVEE